jgi:glycosyltransferase involved in cell wall biosynthesis
VQLGHALKERGEHAKALSAYGEAMGLRVGDGDLLLHIGHVQKLMGHRQLSVSFYVKSAKISGNIHALQELSNLGISEDELEGLFRSAVQLDDSSTREAPDNQRIREEADCARDSGDWESAAKNYKDYLRSNRTDFSIWVQYGNVLKESGRCDDALSAYNVALDLCDMDADLFLQLGHLHKVRGEFPNALKYYQKSCELGGGAEARVEAERLGAVMREPRGVPREPRPLTDIALIRDRMNAVIHEIERRLQLLGATSDIQGPQISILTPVYNVEEVWLRRMVDSVRRQTYPNWQLCLVDDGSAAAHVWPCLEVLAESDARIVIKRRNKNSGISAASNDALALATGDYIALIDNDDMITSDALEIMVRSIVENDRPDWLYSDEFKIDQDDRASSLFAKPDWSPLFLLNYMYTSHLSLYRTELVRDLGGFRSEYDLSQDYDLALRVADTNPRVHHVQSYLYGWRMIEGSGAQGGKPQARITNIAALQDASDRRGWNGVAVPLPTANRLERKIAERAPLVSIIVPSDNADNIRATIKSIFEDSAYSNFEVVVVTKSEMAKRLAPSFGDYRVRWAYYDKKFNFSDKCNLGASLCSGEYIVFFNDDVRVITADWIESLLEFLTLPGVGAVGPKLLYEDGSIQHAGMVTGVRRLVGTAFHAYPANTSEHFNMAQCVREVSVICGALLAMSKRVFCDVGGFDAVNTPINHSDVDLCFRIREAGYSCVYTPYATLTHIGHLSLAEADDQAPKIKPKDKNDIYVLRRFGDLVARDPYFPPPMRDLAYIDSPEDFQCCASLGCPSPAVLDVLIISHDLTNSGAPRVAFDVAILLKSMGLNVVVSAPTDGPVRKKLNDSGIAVIIDSLLLCGHESVTQFARNFDKVIVNTIIGWPAMKQLQDRVDCYWFIHEGSLIDHVANGEPAFRDFLPYGRNILAVSKRTEEFITARGAECTLLETGVEDLSLCWKAGGRLGRVKFGLFGSFEERKGQDIIAHAFSLLPASTRAKAELHFFGRCLDPQFEQAVTERWGHEPNIFLNGEAQHPEYFERLLDMDVVVIPSRDDPLPLVSLDAMALGKPIACSASTGTAYYIQDGISGYVVRQNTVAEWCDLLARLIECPAEMAEVGLQCRRVYEERFTPEAFRLRLLRSLDMCG